MSYLNHTKNLSNFMQLLLRDPERYLPIVEFVDKLVQGASELSWLECEQIFTDISTINGSRFCAGVHTGVGDALEVTATVSRSERLESLLELARKFNKDSATVDESDIQAVRKAGWSDQTVEDVAGLVAIINVYNILASGLGFEALPIAAFREMGEATVQQQGYVPVFKAFIEQAS